MHLHTVTGAQDSGCEFLPAMHWAATSPVMVQHDLNVKAAHAHGSTSVGSVDRLWQNPLSPVCHDALANVCNDLAGLFHCELNLIQVIHNLVELLSLVVQGGCRLQVLMGCSQVSDSIAWQSRL